MLKLAKVYTDLANHELAVEPELERQATSASEKEIVQKEIVIQVENGDQSDDDLTQKDKEREEDEMSSISPSSSGSNLFEDDLLKAFPDLKDVMDSPGTKKKKKGKGKGKKIPRILARSTGDLVTEGIRTSNQSNSPLMPPHDVSNG